jgi:hypothetical protein
MSDEKVPKNVSISLRFSLLRNQLITDENLNALWGNTKTD